MTKYYNDKIIFNHDGYEEVYFPEHPYATAKGTIFVHRLVAETYLGRYLKPQECVHHVDEIKDHNNIENLWVFKTGADHINYHIARKNKLDYVIQCIGGVHTCKIVIPKEYYICPICKGTKSKRAKLCRNCQVAKLRKNSKLDRETLAQLLQTNSYSEIARQYNMSSNGVKKIAIRYGLYQRCFVDCPDLAKLVELLKMQSYVRVAKYFNVSADTVHTWVKNNNICVRPTRYLCVETGSVFDSRNTAAKQMYPTVTYKSAAKSIKKSYVTGKAYCGYHWKLIDREVSINKTS